MKHAWGVFITLVVASVATLSGCQVKRQPTDSERRFFERAKISQATIQDLNNGFFIVTNHTRPADWEQTEVARAMIVSVDFDSLPFEFFWAYYTPAIRHCTPKGQYPDGGELYGPFSKKFRCMNYDEWAVSSLVDDSAMCAYIKQIHHPCSRDADRKRWEYTSEQCSVYSRMFSTQPNQSISCADVGTKLGALRIQSPAPSPAMGQVSVESAKQKCEELGFKSGTEKFGDCVLRLSK